jgi:uncharacterized protein (DUF1499 family)
MNDYYIKPCPGSPNCVSSRSDDDTHAVEPLRYDGDWCVMKQSLIDLIENTPRAVVLKNDAEYVHAAFKSKVFGFIDDVEFIFHDAKKVIHIRSASRVGYYDFGVNRRRVEWLRKALKR